VKLSAKHIRIGWRRQHFIRHEVSAKPGREALGRSSEEEDLGRRRCGLIFRNATDEGAE
jgi:hypothetical protein